MSHLGSWWSIDSYPLISLSPTSPVHKSFIGADGLIRRELALLPTFYFSSSELTYLLPFTTVFYFWQLFFAFILFLEINCVLSVGVVKASTPQLLQH